jgi:hypothetical protein
VACPPCPLAWANRPRPALVAARRALSCRAARVVVPTPRPDRVDRAIMGGLVRHEPGYSVRVRRSFIDRVCRANRRAASTQATGCFLARAAGPRPQRRADAGLAHAVYPLPDPAARTLRFVPRRPGLGTRDRAVAVDRQTDRRRPFSILQ